MDSLLRWLIVIGVGNFMLVVWRNFFEMKRHQEMMDLARLHHRELMDTYVEFKSSKKSNHHSSPIEKSDNLSDGNSSNLGG